MKERMIERFCQLVCEGSLHEAGIELTSLIHLSLAQRLNCQGILEEARKNWPEARKLYHAAIRADSAYPPPRRNMQRLYELETFGRSRIPVLFGHERPALAALLLQRTATRTLIPQ